MKNKEVTVEEVRNCHYVSSGMYAREMRKYRGPVLPVIDLPNSMKPKKE